jgi:hypothetical protein
VKIYLFFPSFSKWFKTLDGVPLEKLKERFYNELHILFELFVILYADDTVLMSNWSFFHRSDLLTVSKAFRKSMKVQNSFFPKEKYNSMRTCSTKILSIVEYPLRKPAWFSCISVTSFAKKLSLVLTMDVNNLPKQLINVIALKLSGSVGHPLFL